MHIFTGASESIIGDGEEENVKLVECWNVFKLMT